jgi:hypothetical protein
MNHEVRYVSLMFLIAHLFYNSYVVIFLLSALSCYIIARLLDFQIFSVIRRYICNFIMGQFRVFLRICMDPDLFSGLWRNLCTILYKQVNIFSINKYAYLTDNSLPAFPISHEFSD